MCGGDLDFAVGWELRSVRILEGSDSECVDMLIGNARVPGVWRLGLVMLLCSTNAGV